MQERRKAKEFNIFKLHNFSPLELMLGFYSPRGRRFVKVKDNIQQKLS